MATSDCQWGHEGGWRAEIEHLGGKWRAMKNENTTPQAVLLFLCMIVQLLMV